MSMGKYKKLDLFFKKGKNRKKRINKFRNL